MREKRLEKIMKIVENRGVVSLKELQEIFGVSLVTIRRDVEELIRRNLVKKVHGGIKKVTYYEGENDFMRRLNTNKEAKEKIAEKALSFLSNGDIVFLDASSTAFVFAKYIANSGKNIHVITNNILTALELSRSPNVNVILLNGILNPERMSIEGTLAVECAKKFYVKKAFMSCRGITQEGTFEINLDVASVKRTFLENSEEVYILADSSKMGKRSLLLLASSERIDYLISDEKPPDGIEKVFREKGVVLVF